MADNENSGGLSLEVLLAAAREASASEPVVEAEGAQEAASADAAAQAGVVEDAGKASTAADDAAQAPAQVGATTAAVESASEPAPASTGGFDLAAALGYSADGSAPARRSSGTSYGSAVSTGSFDLAAALGYASSTEGARSTESASAEPVPASAVNPVALAEAAAREEQAQAAADVVAREAIARAAREEGAPHYRSRYADLPRRTRDSKPAEEAEQAAAAIAAAAQAEAEPVAAEPEAAPAEGASEPAAAVAEGAVTEASPADDLHTHQKAVSRMASASAQAAAAAAEAQRVASGADKKTEVEQAPITFQPLQGLGSQAKKAADQPVPDRQSGDDIVPAAIEEALSSQEPAFMSVQEAEDKAAQRAAEEAAAEEAARAAAERAAQEEAARVAAAQQAAARKAQEEAAARAKAQAQAQAAAAAAAAAQMPPVRPRKAAVKATEEVMVEPLPTQRLGTISYEDAVYADETRQMETAAERKATKKARRYRRFGTFLVIVALLAAAGAAALFLQGTAGASEDIEAKAAEISETAGRTITYRYRAADANGTLCPTTEVATFSTGGVLEQSVITMQTPDFETAGHTLAYFKKQFQDSAYVDGRVDNSSVVFTLHLSSEHLMKSTYTALVMTNTVGCEVII